MKTQQLYVALIILFFYGCSNMETKSDMEKLNEVVSEDTNRVNFSDKIIENMIHTVPSPIELGISIQNSGVEYSPLLLNPTENVKKYTNDYIKAINIGVYGLDLGYMNIYGKTLSTVNYISAIKKLSDDLSVGQFFDFNSLKKLSASDNTDELVELSTNSFLKMNTYLREVKRADISVLIMTGSWIEGIYLTSQIAEKSKNQELKESVGEQKITLDNLMILLSVYKDKSAFSNIIKELEELKKLYEKVTITNVYGKPTTKEVNGVLVFEDNSRNKVLITDSSLQDISQSLKKIRNKLINP